MYFGHRSGGTVTGQVHHEMPCGAWAHAQAGRPTSALGQGIGACFNSPSWSGQMTDLVKRDRKPRRRSESDRLVFRIMLRRAGKEPSLCIGAAPSLENMRRMLDETYPGCSYEISLHQPSTH